VLVGADSGRLCRLVVGVMVSVADRCSGTCPKTSASAKLDRPHDVTGGWVVEGIDVTKGEVTLTLECVDGLDTVSAILHLTVTWTESMPKNK